VTASLTRRIATFAAELSYDRLPADVVGAAKRLVLDSLGCAYAATTLDEGCARVLAVTHALGGPPQSSILGSPEKTSAANAAFANGALANALNYSAAGADTGHTGVPVLAAPLALAEARAPVSGRRLIVAAAIAAELTSRLSLASAAVRATGIERVLFSGQYFCYLAAAAAAGAVIGLDAARMHDALGLALMQVAGSRQLIAQGDPPAKAIFGAFPNQSGVAAALLAEAGLGCSIDALDGRAGFFALVGGTFDRALLEGELGSRFRLLEASFKPWPISGVIMPFVEAALALAEAHDLRSAQVAAVEAVAPSALRQWCEPERERRHPANAATAANSVLFAVAAALAHRALGLDTFTPAGLRDPATRTVAERTSYRVDEGVRGGVVVVRTTDGRILRAAIEIPLGEPRRPLSDDRLRAKFRDCCSHAPTLAPSDVERLIAFVDRLESAADVSPLARGGTAAGAAK
jgi:2-methylcitrate dehydratase PrpD